MTYVSQIGTPDARKRACPVWGGLGGIPLPRGSTDAVLLLHFCSQVIVTVRQQGADSDPRGPSQPLRTGHAASAGAARLAGPPPRRRAPWHGAVPRGQAYAFLLSPICGITSSTDFSHSHTVCCTPPRRREGGR
jgi:hypothetical protein